MLKERISYKEATALYRVSLHLIQSKNYPKLKSTLESFFKKYNKLSPYAVHALIGEISVNLPHEEFDIFSEFLLNKLGISSSELEKYLKKRIKIIMSDNFSEMPSISYDPTNQAEEIIKKAIELDKKLNSTNKKEWSKFLAA